MQATLLFFVIHYLMAFDGLASFHLVDYKLTLPGITRLARAHDGQRHASGFDTGGIVEHEGRTEVIVFERQTDVVKPDASHMAHIEPP